MSSVMRAEAERLSFIEDVALTQRLLRRLNAEDLIGMVTSGLEEGQLYASLPAPLSGRG